MGFLDTDYFNKDFWKQNTKISKRQIFESPEDFIEAAYEYFQWASDNHIEHVQFVGKDGNREVVAKARVFTDWGLARFLHVSHAWIQTFKVRQEAKIVNKDLPELERKKAEEFLLAIEHVQDIIKEQKYTGGTSGDFNAQIIMRDLGLTDKADVKHSGDKDNPVVIESELDVKNLSTEELRKFLSGVERK